MSLAPCRAGGVSVALALSAVTAARGGAVVEREVLAMGTRLHVSVEAADRAAALAASDAAIEAITRVEARLSTWNPSSELSRLNASPVGTPFRLSRDLAADLALARRAWQETGEAFDPGVGALVDAWDLRGSGKFPGDDELDLARAATGLRHLDLTDRVAVRRHAGLRLEEGGFGKGVGLDEALRAVSAAGASRAVLDFGGQIAFLGEVPLEVDLADPDDRERPALRLAIDAGSVSTSGNGERGIVVAGRRIGHILDPRTGRPAPDFGTLTVWATSASVADALSTGLYVLGPERALEWAEARSDVGVVVLERSPSGLRARASRGLVARLTSLDPDLQLECPAEETSR